MTNVSPVCIIAVKVWREKVVVSVHVWDWNVLTVVANIPQLIDVRPCGVLAGLALVIEILLDYVLGHLG